MQNLHFAAPLCALLRMVKKSSSISIVFCSFWKSSEKGFFIWKKKKKNDIRTFGVLRILRSSARVNGLGELCYYSIFVSTFNLRKIFIKNQNWEWFLNLLTQNFECWFYPIFSHKIVGSKHIFLSLFRLLDKSKVEFDREKKNIC